MGFVEVCLCPRDLYGIYLLTVYSSQVLTNVSLASFGSRGVVQ
jgi:hypothetical protein